jgi:hypothetical protein
MLTVLLATGQGFGQHQEDAMVYPNTNEFLQFIKERERIRIARSRMQAAPWTTDPILATYRFCNVNRQHDRETIAIQAWLKDVAGNLPERYLVINAIMARLFNRALTLRAIGPIDGPLEESKLLQILEAGAAKVPTPFNPAYIVSTNGVAMPKVKYLATRVLAPLVRNLSGCMPTTCAGMAGTLLAYDGIGDFIANQVVTDLKYLEESLLYAAPDWETFFLAGPGTRRGINRLMGKPINTTMKGIPAWMIWFREKIAGRTAFDIDDHFKDMNNLGNCFCEFDKYVRAKTGEGKPKQLYRVSP